MEEKVCPTCLRRLTLPRRLLRLFDDLANSVMGVEDKQADSHIVSSAVVEKRVDYDSESQSGEIPQDGKLKRQLKNRHIAMIRYVLAIFCLSCGRELTALRCQYRRYVPFPC